MGKKTGYILILALLITAALFVLVVASTDLYYAESRVSASAANDLIAEQAASAGIDAAVYQLKQSAAWSSGFNGIVLPHSSASYSMTFSASNLSVPYSTNNSQGSGQVTGFGGRVVPAGMVYVISIGEYGGSVRREDALIGTSGGISVKSRWREKS